MNDLQSKRTYTGFRLPAEQLTAIDEVRVKLRQSKSQFVRQAIAEHLRRLDAAK
jgi:predicted DNA-binding protein